MLSITYTPTADLKNWLRIKKSDADKFSFTQYYPFDRTLSLEESNSTELLKTISEELINNYQKKAEKLGLIWEEHNQGIWTAIINYLHYGQPMDLKASLTTAYRMPYDARDNWFMIPAWKNTREQLKVIVHEVFHLLFIQKYPDSTYDEREHEVEKFLEQHKTLYLVLESEEK